MIGPEGPGSDVSWFTAIGAADALDPARDWLTEADAADSMLSVDGAIRL
jgi:hypothetical protein